MEASHDSRANQTYTAPIRRMPQGSRRTNPLVPGEKVITLGTDASVRGTDATVRGTDASVHGTDAPVRGTDAPVPGK